MIASTVSRYGPPSIIKVMDLEKPEPEDDEVLVRVRAATVNRTDLGILKGKPFIIRFFTGVLAPKRITGTDFAGEIKVLGKDVKTFKAGDRVFGFHDGGLGSHAEYMVISEKGNIMKMPENISFDQAAAGLEGAHYAYNFLNKVGVEKGSLVLINGATGAIGSAALQFLKNKGAKVTAVCGTKNTRLVKSLGADKVIDYMKQDFTEDEQTYDFVFDAVGKSTFGKCRKLLADDGVYISSELGPFAQNIFFALMKPLTARKIVKFPFPSDIKGSIRFIKQLLEKGKFKPLIDRKYPLSKIREAYEYVETGKKVGNVVIRI